MRILGIDPGLTRLGAAVLEKQPRKLLTAKLFETSPLLPENERVLEVYSFIESLIKKFDPELIAIERPFLTNHNPNTAFGVVQAIAAVNIISAKKGIEIVSFSPTEVKAAVSGFGGAKKAQIRLAIAKILNLTETQLNSLNPKADVSDAIATALTAALRSNFNKTNLTGSGTKQIKVPKTNQLTTAQKLWKAAEK